METTMSSEPCPFDRAPDAADILDYVMAGQGYGPQKRGVAIENLRGLSDAGLAQLRAEMRGATRQAQQASHADTYDPWGRD
jgi:hypothetical protein